MEELLVQVQAFARGMWRHRWPAVAISWVVGLVAAVAAFQVPDRWEASARIYVDTQSILKPLMSGLTVQPNVDQQVAMLSRTLISRPNVEKLVRMADLDLQDGSKTKSEERIDMLMRTLQIQSVGRDNLFTLSYRDSNPEHAKRVVQSLVSIFVESSLGASRRDTDAAKVFIAEQIKAYQAKLEEAETRVKEFRMRNIDVEFAEGRDSAARISELAAQLDAARIELKESEQALIAARAGLEAERVGAKEVLPPLLDSGNPAATPATPELDARIDAQRRNLDGLLQRFTEAHPDVVAGRRLLRELEDQKSLRIAELKKSAARAAGSDAGAPDTLALQELRRIVAASEIQVAVRRARVAELSARFDRIRARLKDSPRLEAEAAQLNRDYAIHKKAYEDLVARRESAALSGNLESVSGVVDFRLVDPPRVSPRPISPNRLLLLAGAMLLALLAGLAWAFAASQLRPVVHRVGDLREKFGLPVLGSVSLVMSDAERRRERWSVVRFSLASGSLLALFAGGIVVTAVVSNFAN